MKIYKLLKTAIRPLRQKVCHYKQTYFENFIFIHINKTGGSSIEKALGTHFEHSPAINKINEIGKDRWNSKFTFSFVRNPWDKVVSHYQYRVDTNQTNLREKPLNFPEWVKLAYGEKNVFYNNSKNMFMPQLDWIVDPNDNIIVDFVGRFERIEEDFMIVCERIKKNPSLPHLKRSNRKHYKEYYDEESIDIVSKHFNRDIEAFSYKF